MSVLDRAIVKAFERRRVSITAATAADELPCAAVNDHPAPEVLSNSDSIRAPESAPINSLASADSTDAPQQTSQVAAEETAEKQSPAVVEQPLPEPAQTPVVAVKSVPVTPPFPRELFSYTTSTSTASIAPKNVAVSKPAPPEPAPVREWQWPVICEQLDQFTGDGFRQLAKHLQFAAAQGHKVLAFVSSAPAAGRTSVVLTLTRILAQEGRTHALLIDADRRHPDLATLTGLPPVPGLGEVLRGQATVPQVIVPRSPGNISSLTLQAPISDEEWPRLTTPLRTLAQQARRDYEMVLVDAGVIGPETMLADCWLREVADAVITISRQLTEKDAAHEVLDWKQIGIESLGVIETFS